MKAKLIKTPIGYYRLMVENSDYDYGHTSPEYCKLQNKDGSYTHKLSLKNCQAIERGYDLDELARQSRDKVSMLFKDGLHEKSHTVGFRAGWQHAINLNGDRKFSRGELLNAMDLVFQWINGEEYGCQNLTEVQDKYIESLQQTEWDVEIEMENYEPLYGMGSTPRLKLDADGCLILKRI